MIGGQRHEFLAGQVRLASFQVSFHQPLLDRTGAHWLDTASDLSCKDNTGQHALDDRGCLVNSRFGPGLIG